MSKRRHFDSVNVLIVGCNELALQFASALYKRRPCSLTFSDFESPDSAIEFGRRFAELQTRSSTVRYAAHSLAPTEEFLLNFDLVIAVQQTLHRILAINEFCRVRQRWNEKLGDFVEEAIGFVVLDVFGLVCSLFCDFGNTFAFRESDKFFPSTAQIKSVVNGLPTVVELEEMSDVSSVTEAHILSNPLAFFPVAATVNTLTVFPAGVNLEFLNVIGLIDFGQLVYKVRTLDKYRRLLVDVDTSWMLENTFRSGALRTSAPMKSTSFVSFEDHIYPPRLVTEQSGPDGACRINLSLPIASVVKQRNDDVPALLEADEENASDAESEVDPVDELALRILQLHCLVVAFRIFAEDRSRLPGFNASSDSSAIADMMAELGAEFNKFSPAYRELDELVLRQLCSYSAYTVPFIVDLFCEFAAQECETYQGNRAPLHQEFVYDFSDSLPRGRWTDLDATFASLSGKEAWMKQRFNDTLAQCGRPTI